MSDARRTYYDHEPAYQRIVEAGGRGWDDVTPGSGRDSYDALDAFLDSDWFDLLPIRACALDLGCGGGQGTIRLAQRGCRAHGVDFSSSAIALARENAVQLGLNVNFKIEDALTLDGFDDEQFDLVIDNHTLHCIIEDDHRREFFAAAHRVLKPGGLVFSETMSAEGRLDVAAFEIDPKTRQNRNRTRFWTTQHELCRLLTDAGFSTLSQTFRQQNVSPPVGEMIVTIARRL